MVSYENNMPKALIVGTGLGGLATALRLAKRGYQVDMVEKSLQPGGRLNQIKRNGFTWDMGPTFFSMSYEFDEFIQDTGIDMPFEFIELDPLYAVNFRGQDRNFLIYKNLAKLAEEFKDLEPDLEKKVSTYLAGAGKLFHDTENLVIKKNFDTKLHYLLSLAQVPPKHAPKMFRSVWSELEKHFESRELKEILSLVSFFLGATPFDTPAVFTLLSYTELVHDGYYNVKGGMYKIVEGLVKELQKAKVRLIFETEITGFEGRGNQLTALIDQQGQKHEYDLYVVNADAAWFRHAIFKRPKFSADKLDKMHWTMAPLTIYLGLNQKVPEFHHHHYFLGDNFKEYAGGIFQNSVSLKQPYYYVNVPSKNNPECAPEGHEAVFILCPVPHKIFKPDWSDRDEIVADIIEDLGKRIGVDLKNKLVEQIVLDPNDWERAFNLYQGSGLGLAHDLNQIGGFRPANRDEQFKNVFYVGASTIPGTGLPMTMISSKLVTERIVKQYGSLH